MTDLFHPGSQRLLQHYIKEIRLLPPDTADSVVSQMMLVSTACRIQNCGDTTRLPRKAWEARQEAPKRTIHEAKSVVETPERWIYQEGVSPTAENCRS